jgi:hypothetical protein
MPILATNGQYSDVANLTPPQWDVITNIIRILQPFEEITRDISAASISIVIPAVKALYALLTAVKDDAGVKATNKQMRLSLRTRTEGFEINPLYTVATLLDPRFKTRCFDGAGASQAKQSFLLAAGEATLLCATTSSDTVDLGEPSAKRRRASDPWNFLDAYITESEAASTSLHGERVAEQELSAYLSECLLPRTSDPLLWWQGNCGRFPIMARFARRYLSAPPTSVPSERLFSTAGDVLSDHRSRLLPDNAERLILLKRNMQYLS